MPDFLEDPSVLTKERLKSELLAHSVALPASDQRKDVYVQLYRQHLSARNKAKGRDFSSDEEARESTPARGRPRKATKKTDKPRLEEKDDLDVTGLGNEDLKEELIKYGVNPGPIIASTRKVYEKRLLKLREKAPEVPPTPPAVSSTAEESKQNGNTDSDQYSDNEDPEIILKLEKREPLKGRLKAQVTLGQRVEHNQTFSEDAFTETSWTSGSIKTGHLQTVARETAPVSRRTPRKRVGAAEQTFDEAVISGSTPIAEILMASSNQTVAPSEFERFESRQAANKITGNFKHTAPLLSASELSELPRRTPKKTFTSEEVKVVEKTATEERRFEKDILKEMFPFEASTPTGISVSCRRPIKGAAGRPVQLSEFKMEGSFSSKYVPKYATPADAKPQTAKKGRSVPIWMKIFLFVIVAVFLFLVYQAMETNEGNPFTKYIL